MRPERTYSKSEVTATIERRIAKVMARHRAEVARLHKVLDDTLRSASVLSAALESLEHENNDLRRQLTELRTIKRVAMWRTGRILSWRSWWRSAAED